ncbi:MAG: ferritin-like domain-containing protein [Gammaproteobacteria bacterium]|jgi:uncharacterized ferritin-like protein (DUF455 family)
MMPGESLYARALRCLQCGDPERKCRLTDAAFEALCGARLRLDGDEPPLAVSTPGRPARPHLVAPRDLPNRKLGSTEGRAGLLHALAHIEFNAINLAWDAVYRFRGLPQAYYRDWARVAKEEAYHFRLLCERLGELGYAYGDFDAHDGLWEMACKTAHDPLVRMALVPRVLEARGLDVTPAILERLRKSGDARAVEILRIILRDEIGHVEIGTRWFRYLCAQRGLAPEATFVDLLNEYMRGRVKKPFHYEARQRAGFNELEMQYLEELAS